MDHSVAFAENPATAEKTPGTARDSLRIPTMSGHEDGSVMAGADSSVDEPYLGYSADWIASASEETAQVTVVVVAVERFKDVGGDPRTKKRRGDCIVPAVTVTQARPDVAGQEGGLPVAEIMEIADDAALHTIVRVSVRDGVEGRTRDRGVPNHGQDAIAFDTTAGELLGSALPLDCVGALTVRVGIEQPTSVVYWGGIRKRQENGGVVAVGVGVYV